MAIALPNTTGGFEFFPPTSFFAKSGMNEGNKPRKADVVGIFLK